MDERRVDLNTCHSQHVMKKRPHPLHRSGASYQIPSQSLVSLMVASRHILQLLLCLNRGAAACAVTRFAREVQGVLIYRCLAIRGELGGRLRVNSKQMRPYVTGKNGSISPGALMSWSKSMVMGESTPMWGALAVGLAVIALSLFLGWRSFNKAEV